MDLERAVERQRLKLLRVLAGLVAAVAFLALAPLSREARHWIGGTVASVLSRAEVAAQYLVIAQARGIARRSGSLVDERRLAAWPVHDFSACESAFSLDDLCRRVRALRSVLDALPRHGLRLLRRVEKAVRRLRETAPNERASRRPDASVSVAFGAWRLAAPRIERPPDKKTEYLAM